VLGRKLPAAGALLTDEAVSFRVSRSHLYAAAGVLVGFIAGFGVASLLFGPGARARRPPVQAEVGPPINVGEIPTAGRPSRGRSTAPVTIVEFTDYQCPFCRRHVRTTMPAILSAYGDRIRYVVRNYPIPSLHPDAPKAAEAAECSHDQGKFWPYHDRLMQADKLEVPSLKRYAGDLGLDSVAFNRCLDSGAKTALVAQDVRDARGYGARGTPAIFVNGRLFAGAMPFEVFAAYLDTLLSGSPGK
jgi:protein-disulfide isomerase